MQKILITQSKKCIKCFLEKSLSSFTKDSNQKDGLHYYCKSCKKSLEKIYRTPEKNRKYNLKRSFGLNPEQYNEMLRDQKGVCAICKNPETTVRQNKVQSLSIDHDHLTGKIRGLLCNNCNRALGKFGDNINILKNAVRYLERHKWKNC